MDELTVVREHLVVAAPAGVADPLELRSVALLALRQIDPALADHADEIDVRVGDD
jgi:hypothetical protein